MTENVSSSYDILDFWIGGVFGCVTCLPMNSIVGGKPKTRIEGAIES